MSLAKGLSIYMNGVSLGCALQTIDATAETEALDSTTLCQSSKTYQKGLKNGTISASGIWNYDSTDLDEIHNVFSTAYSGGGTSYVLATLEALAGGTTCFAFDAVQSSYGVEIPNGQLIMANADFQAIAGINYGKVVFTASVASTTTSSTGVDFGTGSTSNGGYLQYQLQNPSQIAGSITFEHSTDNSTWVTLGSAVTINAGGSKLTAGSQEITGTVYRYIRATVVATGGTLTVQAAVSRR